MTDPDSKIHQNSRLIRITQKSKWLRRLRSELIGNERKKNE